MCTKIELDMILNDFVEGTKNIFGKKLKDVILFGSYARGDYDQESDVDIAILVDIPREEERIYTDDIVALMSKVDKKYSYTVLLAPIVLSSNFFEEWYETIPFYWAVKNEGVRLNV
ncbi:MAG: nucleotidyltransferase domain-containing protein [Clostridiales bacterium]|nr:nucleotidyltransferase domain-containing protein [Clostridiales bacterium]